VSTKLLRDMHGRCLDGGAENNGVHMWECDPSNHNQEWEYNGDIGRLWAPRKGMCLDGGKDAGSDAQLVDCNEHSDTQAFATGVFASLIQVTKKHAKSKAVQQVLAQQGTKAKKTSQSWDSGIFQTAHDVKAAEDTAANVKAAADVAAKAAADAKTVADAKVAADNQVTNDMQVLTEVQEDADQAAANHQAAVEAAEAAHAEATAALAAEAAKQAEPKAVAEAAPAAHAIGGDPNAVNPEGPKIENLDHASAGTQSTGGMVSGFGSAQSAASQTTVGSGLTLALTLALTLVQLLF